MRKILKIHKKKPLYLKKVENRIKAASSEKGSSLLNVLPVSDEKLNQEASHPINAAAVSTESATAESIS